VFITVSHSIIAHHHHFKETLAELHHPDDDHDHSVFSFGQLDENFIFSQSHTTISNDVNTTLFLIPANPLLVTISCTISRTNSITHQEFPPPEDYFHSTLLRGPPTV
ncbi:MAG: hypothetical protein V4506_08975, partial [Bacteroidota bacterium]